MIRLIMCKWIECLTLAESMGNEYKEVYAQNMLRVCQDTIRDKYEVLNPVWRNYFSLCVKYNQTWIEKKIRDKKEREELPFYDDNE